MAPRQYPKGQVLFYADDPIENIFVVQRGVVKSYWIDDDGNEHIVMMLPPGSLFPCDTSLIEDVSVCQYFHEAMTDVLVGRADSSGTKAENTRRLDKEYLKQLAEALSRISALQTKSAIHKVRLTVAYAQKIIRAGGQQYRLTHQDIAELTGLTRETVTTALRQGQQGLENIKGGKR